MNSRKPMVETLAVILPAAGQAKRMRGGDKLLEEVDGEPLLRRLSRFALQTVPLVSVAVPDLEEHAPRRSGSCCDDDTSAGCRSGHGQVAGSRIECRSPFYRGSDDPARRHARDHSRGYRGIGRSFRRTWRLVHHPRGGGGWDTWTSGDLSSELPRRAGGTDRGYGRARRSEGSCGESSGCAPARPACAR